MSSFQHWVVYFMKASSYPVTQDVTRWTCNMIVQSVLLWPRVWLINWHRGDTYRECTQCHKCHIWSMERWDVWVSGCCSPYTAGGNGTERLVSTWAYFGRTTFPWRPECWVMSWVVVVGGTRHSECPCSLSTQSKMYMDTGCYHRAAWLPSQAAWQWMMCLFITADRCHVRHALSSCKVSHVFFLW